MSFTGIMAEPEPVRAAGRKLVSNAENYLSAVRNIYRVVDGLKVSWQGADNQSFVGTVYKHKENIDALGQVIGNYGVFLQETANSLEHLQAEIAQQATTI